MKLRIRILLAVVALALLLTPGVSASPALQTQTETELEARLDRLEALVAQQNEQIESLMTRVAELECALDSAMCETSDDTIPDEWIEGISTDNSLRYYYHPSWQITDDEPGAISLQLRSTAQILSVFWDSWPGDLGGSLADEELQQYIEELMLESLAGDSNAELLSFYEMQIAGRQAAVWEVSFSEGEDVEYGLRGLAMFYACSESHLCGIILFQPGIERPFLSQDWQVLRTLAASLEFVTEEAIVNRPANLRACPGVSCDIVGRATRGQVVEIMGQSADGDWYLLSTGEWIAEWLVDGAPEELPVMDGSPNL